MNVSFISDCSLKSSRRDLRSSVILFKEIFILSYE